jgi:hypothetical protein
VIHQEPTTGHQLPLAHPDWCDRVRCTADLPDGIHIGTPNLVPLGEHPADGAAVQRIQATPSFDQPDPPVKLGIRWRGGYSRIPPIVIALDRAVFLSEVLRRAAQLD